MSDDAASELRRCIQLLAQDASVQTAAFPSFVAVGDELGLSFESALQAYRTAPREISQEQDAALMDVDAYLESLSGPPNEALWLDLSLLAADPRWDRIRTLAKVVVRAFGWPNELPSRDGAIYVSATETVRND